MLAGQHRIRRFLHVGGAAALVALTAACSDATGASDDVRAGAPFVTGRISVRPAGEWPTIVVERDEQRPGECGSSVNVVVRADADIRWADGSVGSADQLTVGQAVTVWSGSPSLAICPVEVGAIAVTVAGSPPAG